MLDIVCGVSQSLSVVESTKRTITALEAAYRLGVSRSMIYYLVKTKQIDGTRPQRDLLIDEESVENYATRKGIELRRQ